MWEPEQFVIASDERNTLIKVHESECSIISGFDWYWTWMDMISMHELRAKDNDDRIIYTMLTARLATQYKELKEICREAVTTCQRLREQDEQLSAALRLRGLPNIDCHFWLFPELTLRNLRYVELYNLL